MNQVNKLHQPLVKEATPILVADDDQVTLRILSATLSKWGFKVFQANNGLTAWDTLNDHPIHLVITDVDMPGMNGHQLCKRIRTNKTDAYTYVITLTQHLERDSVVQALEAGADDFAGKPFDPVELRARLGVALRILHLEQELRRSKVSLEIANQNLHTEALTDALTGINNRRALDDTLQRVHQWALQQQRPYSLLMADIDFFKPYNDTLGHAAGDQTLQAIARCLRKHLRTGDEVFRYGGEEFLILLPDLCDHGLQEEGDRLRARIAALRMPHPTAPAGVVTLSIGGSAFLPDTYVAPTTSPKHPRPAEAPTEEGAGAKASPATPVVKATQRERVSAAHAQEGVDPQSCPTWQDVAREADAALYEAKGQGRDQVVIGAVVREKPRGKEWQR